MRDHVIDLYKCWPWFIDLNDSVKISFQSGLCWLLNGDSLKEIRWFVQCLFLANEGVSKFHTSTPQLQISGASFWSCLLKLELQVNIHPSETNKNTFQPGGDLYEFYTRPRIYDTLPKITTWLVVEPTQLKNIGKSKWESSPRFGVKIPKILEKPPPSDSSPLNIGLLPPRGNLIFQPINFCSCESASFRDGTLDVRYCYQTSPKLFPMANDNAVFPHRPRIQMALQHHDDWSTQQPVGRHDPFRMPWLRISIKFWRNMFVCPP